tara:strand:- start:194 stop:511 length:318 start_codon:yes stop_codon:yes gene_type:complete
MPMGTGTYGSKVGRPKKRKKMMGGSMAKKKDRMMYKKGKAVTKKKAKKVMIKGADVSALTTRQQETMKKHSVHHTGKHMKMMTAMMKKGKTFSQAHKETQKKVGK